MEQMLERIAEDGLEDPRWFALLQALKDGRIKLDVLFTHYVKGEIDDLKTRLHDPLLTEIVAEYRRVDKDPKIRQGLNQLLEYAPEDARLRWLKNGKNILHACIHFEEDGLKRNSVRRTLYTAASKLCRYAFGEAERDTIFASVAFVEQDDTRDVALTERALWTLLEAADDEIRCMILIAATSGADKGPLLRLTVSDVRFYKSDDDFYAELYLRDKKSDARPRSVIVDTEIAHLLYARCEGKKLDEAVFPINENTFWWRFSRIRTAAGMPNLRFKDLRRTALVAAERSGMSHKQLQMMAGHRRAQTTTKYLQHQTTLSREQARLIAAQFGINKKGRSENERGIETGDTKAANGG